MSCFNNNCYLPQPPRAWSRVQNSCSLITDTNTEQLGLDKKIAMLNKGNILQYKVNSSNLTKAQRYSKIAKGQWINRNTTWATQSTRGYTNPNTTSLKRSGNVVNIEVDPITGAIIGPTFMSPTCASQIIPINDGLPSNIGAQGEEEPKIPPPIEPTPSSETFPNIIPDTPVEPIVIQDGGVLICSVQENICTGETKSTISQQLCNLTSDSDVPGPIQELCWNDGTPTWYPRQRYVMTNSTNKWPVNAELFGAIKINAPYITSITSNTNIVTLTWTFTDSCLPASNFNIYQDGILVKTVLGNIFTTEIIVSNCSNYEYYIVAENITAKTVSEPSNVVSIYIDYIETPILVSVILDTFTPNTFYNVIVSWNNPTQCSSGSNTNIYANNTFVVSVPSNISTYTIATPTPNNYTINLTASINSNESPFSNALSVTVLPIYNVSGNSTLYTNSNTTLLLFDDITTNSSLTFNYTITNINFIIIAGGGGGGLQSNLNNYPGGGGGGGGYLYTTSPSPVPTFISTPLLPISITIGSGGLGSPYYINNNNNGQNGSNTTITNINGLGTSYTASFGVGSDGANGSFGGSNPYGAGNSGGYQINGNAVANSSQPGNFGYGGYGGSGKYDSIDPPKPGDSSNNTPFTLPFTISGNTTINISGGGGGAINNVGGPSNNGGGCGNGIGGSSGGSGTTNGVSASNMLPSYGGGGGGGVGQATNPVGDTGGNGGQGVAMIWFQT